MQMPLQQQFENSDLTDVFYVKSAFEVRKERQINASFAREEASCVIIKQHKQTLYFQY
jgi:hypothetical protein